MNWPLVARLLGLLSLLIGAAMTVSLPWSFPFCGQTEVFEQRTFNGFLQSIGITVCVGLALISLGRKTEGSLLRKEALAVVGLGWLMCGILGGLPFLLTPTYRLPGVPMNVSDAIFESISGFTTTGASVLTQLEVPDTLPDGTASCEIAAVKGQLAYVPRSTLFWRSFTHWLGGMGIIVLFVAILGQLGAGGKALMRREVPGPMTDNVRPRIRETATLMWTIYLGLSVALAIILAIEGMSIYDSLCHTFGTLATGGFSTKNASVGSFECVGIELTLIAFMVAAGTNFNLYYLLVSNSAGKSWKDRLFAFFSDAEYRAYLGIIAFCTSMLCGSLWLSGRYEFGDSLRHSLFNVVTVITTTGFGTEDFAQWPEVTRVMLLILMFVGGCSGSTGGGIKVIRFLVLWQVLRIESARAFQPNLVQPLRIAGRKIDPSVGRDVLVYFALMGMIAAGSWVALMAIEPSIQWQGETQSEKLIDCASSVAATLNNIGPGLGVCGPHGNYTHFSDTSKLVLTLLMLLGRLELFAIIVLFVPRFWKVQ